MQTILGSGGVVANALSAELVKNNEPFRAVNRSGNPTAGATENLRIDLLDAHAVQQAVSGSGVVYLVAGLAYNIRVWQEQWPKIMTNVIAACSREKAALIFFDNVYAYGLVKGAMTETTPYSPISKKGEVRMKIALQLMREVQQGNLVACIARAADFYGPHCNKSVFNLLVADRFAKGKSAQWMLNDEVKHSFTYTPDAGKAIYLLSKNKASMNQVWHMPTASPALTGKQLIAFGCHPLFMQKINACCSAAPCFGWRVCLMEM